MDELDHQNQRRISASSSAGGPASLHPTSFLSGDQLAVNKMQMQIGDWQGRWAIGQTEVRFLPEINWRWGENPT